MAVEDGEAELIELVDLIRRHRRRIRLIMLASYGCVTAAAGAILTAVAYQFRGGVGVGWAAGAAGLALGSATLLAWLRCPTVQATGSALDRELRLDDRVAAALEAREGHEPVAPLIVRDALLRLRGVKPAQVFPMKLGRPAAVATAGFVGTALLFTLGAPPGPGPEQASAARGGGVRAEGGARSSPAGPLRGRSSEANGERGVPGSQQQVAAPSVAAGQQAAPAGAQPGTTSTRAPGDQRESTADSSQALGGTTAGGAPSGDGRRSTDNQGAADGSGAGAPARGAASTTTRATGTAQGAAGRSGETLGGTAVGSGGVQGEALGSNADVARTLARRGGLSVTSRADAAWTSAGAAMSSDDVPPRRRSYVRDYFIAVRRLAQP